jgi:hypothetical protein
MHKLTTDRRKWGVCALLAGIGMALASRAALYLWWRLPGAAVSVNGRPATHAAVYRSPEGQILVQINEPNGDITDIISPSDGDVRIASYEGFLDDMPEQNHFLITPLFALIADDRYRPRWEHHYDDDEPSFGAVIRPESAEFTEMYLPSGRSSLRSWRVRVEY